MIPLEKQVVSLEPAKRLKELGVKQESFWAWYDTTDRDDTPHFNRFDAHCTGCTLPKQAWEAKYAAFTVAELGELLHPHAYSIKGQSEKVKDKWICRWWGVGSQDDMLRERKATRGRVERGNNRSRRPRQDVDVCGGE